MSSVKSEYERFLAHLATVPASDNVRRMANLVMANLAPLAEVGATRRARSVRLAPLAVAQLLQTSPEPPPAPVEVGVVRTFGRLHQLEVGPFRGFMRQETFDLSRNITLVYGANGTGKSSFCEALETAMLGSMSEAQAKRVEHRVYSNNARLRRYTPPRLMSRLADDEPMQIRPSEEDYRFCFIEKNRLDDFARIAARTPGDQRQLIATLFGLDQFSDFVRGFNPSLDDNLNLVGIKALQLDAKRRQLAVSEQTIRLHPEKLRQFDRQEHELAHRIQPGSSFLGCCQWLLGAPEQEGRLPFVQAVLQGAQPTIHGVSQENLQFLLSEAYRINGLLESLTAQLTARASEVSYSQLYAALLGLAEGATVCPACGTDLNNVQNDPFEHARAGLRQLEQLGVIQRQQQACRDDLNESMRSLLSAMSAAVHAATQVAGAANILGANLPVLPDSVAGTWLQAWMDAGQRAWVTLLQYVALVEQADLQAHALEAQRQLFAQEHARLQAFYLEIERCKTLRAAAEGELIRAQAEVAQFEEQNQKLIAEVAAETGVMEHHRLIKTAYDGFLPALQNYLTGLPANLFQGLAAQARDLYNAFNRDDPPPDLLHALSLPMAENGKIEMEFSGEPGVRYDALVILSEGHIKCLGLAILLAKNLAQKCPVVIFDDVVNAIDDEHRNGIWRTFFENGLLDGKQIILTSHAEEFLLRIQQEIGAERARDIKLYKFLPHLGDHELLVDSHPPTKNYVLLSQAAFQKEEKRDALRHARPAIESLTDRIWTWLGNYSDGKLELGLTGPRAKWELNNKCSKLRGALKRIAARPGLQEVIDSLDRLLGITGGSIEWRYLNTGNHDAQLDHEFDRATVRTIIEAVGALDAGLSQLKGR